VQQEVAARDGALTTCTGTKLFPLQLSDSLCLNWAAVAASACWRRHGLHSLQPRGRVSVDARAESHQLLHCSRPMVKRDTQPTDALAQSREGSPVQRRCAAELAALTGVTSRDDGERVEGGV